MAGKADDSMAGEANDHMPGKADSLIGKANDYVPGKADEKANGKKPRKANNNTAGKAHSNVTGKKDQDFSRLICTTLDTFGFDREAISFRSNFYEKASRLLTKHSFRDGIPGTTVFVGSLAEGIGLADSNLDKISIIEDSVCVDKGSKNIPFNILETDYTTSPPGFTKIVPVCSDKNSKVRALLNASNMYGSRRRRPYISSTVFKNCVNQWAKSLVSEHYAGSENEDVTSKGPTVARNIFAGKQYIDPCIYFYGGNYASKWANRARFYAWPSEDLVREISEMEGYIVPEGDALSETQHIEWRICYTTAEQKLVSSLNDVQMKLYIVLKLIGKKLLKPVCKEINSYAVKNVVFWIVEMTHAKEFSPEQLMSLVLKSLYFIKHCLLNNHLPNYMIPDRNMLAAVRGQDKRKAICFISKCLKDRTKIVLKVPELRKCIKYTRINPERRLHWKMRNEAEKLVYEILLQTAEHYDVNLFSNGNLLSLFEIELNCFKSEPSRYLDLRFKLFNVVVPEWLDLMAAGRFREMQELLIFRLEGLRLL